VLQGISDYQKRLVGVRFKLTNSLIYTKLCTKVVRLSVRLSTCTSIVIYISTRMKLIVKDVNFILLRLFNLPLNPYLGKVINTVIVKSGQVVGGVKTKLRPGVRHRNMIRQGLEIGPL